MKNTYIIEGRDAKGNRVAGEKADGDRYSDVEHLVKAMFRRHGKATHVAVQKMFGRGHRIYARSGGFRSMK